MSEDEARHTVETGAMYVILPAHSWWREGNWPQARPVADGFSYSSQGNARWLTDDDFKGLLDGLDTAAGTGH